VFVQIRPSSDAFYESSIEPWSEWLTGKQGRSPSPYYDPLKFIIEECHKRGIEVHAWFNPFRSVMNVNLSSISPQHVSRLHPSWNVTYGNYKWLNPGLPEVSVTMSPKLLWMLYADTLSMESISMITSIPILLGI
jgi:uncharacterized lipoprotein YddW (UPF0748 family)